MGEKGAVDEVLITVVGLFLAVGLMIGVPLLAVAQRNDDIAQSVVQAATSNVANTVAMEGKIDPSVYEAYLEELAATGNTYEVEIEVKHLDENLGNKSIITSGDLIGENIYYSTYTTEILGTMYPSAENVSGALTSTSYPLKKGDIIVITVKNTNSTLAQSLGTFFFKVLGKDTSQIVASASSMAVNTGTN